MQYVYKRHVPEGIGELMDHLAYIMLSGPEFIDPDFIGRDMDAAFFELDEGLRLLRRKRKFPEERLEKLLDLSSRIRVLYEADLKGSTGDALRGRELILEMEELLGQRKPPT